MTGSTELSPKSHYAMRVIGWFHLWCAEVQRQYQETMTRLQRMENVTGLTKQLYARIMAEHGPSRGETIH
jgi:hypothetical protein